jgi:hypothetical protein
VPQLKNFHILVAADFEILLSLIAVRILSQKTYYISGSYPRNDGKRRTTLTANAGS